MVRGGLAEQPVHGHLERGGEVGETFAGDAGLPVLDGAQGGRADAQHVGEVAQGQTTGMSEASYGVTDGGAVLRRGVSRLAHEVQDN